MCGDGAGFVYANVGDKGYYRTNYGASELAAIVANAEAGLTPPERIGLLGDRWALMRGGEGTVGEFLDLMLAVKQDPNATVLDSALGKVEAIDKLIATDADRARMDAMVRREFGPVYAALGTPDKHESWDRVELRGTLFGALGEAGDPAVLAQADRVTEALFEATRWDLIPEMRRLPMRRWRWLPGKAMQRCTTRCCGLRRTRLIRG